MLAEVKQRAWRQEGLKWRREIKEWKNRPVWMRTRHLYKTLMIFILVVDNDCLWDSIVRRFRNIMQPLIWGQHNDEISSFTERDRTPLCKPAIKQTDGINFNKRSVGRTSTLPLTTYAMFIFGVIEKSSSTGFDPMKHKLITEKFTLNAL